MANTDPQKAIQKKLNEPYKVKSYDLNNVKGVDMEKRTVMGVSNMFYWFDSDYDVLVPGCTSKTIKENGPQSGSSGKIKHALFHDLTKLPGKVQMLDERKMSDGRECQYFESKMLNTVDGNDTLIKYQEEVYDQHSIGFRYLDIEFMDDESSMWKKCIDKLINPEDAEEAGFMFWVKEIKQFEFSTVAFGANKLTPYLGTKSESKEARLLKLTSKIDHVSSFLRNGKSLSDDGFILLELELLQLKQLLAESMEDEPSIKDILIKDRLGKDTPQKFDLLSAIKETNFFKD